MSKKNQTNSAEYMRMYMQMMRIRAFEDNANQLYLSAKMPGLTHMYSGQEAVALSRHISQSAARAASRAVPYVPT